MGRGTADTKKQGQLQHLIKHNKTQHLFRIQGYMECKHLGVWGLGGWVPVSELHEHKEASATVQHGFGAMGSISSDDPKDLHITTHLIAATTAQLLHNVEEVNHIMTFLGSVLFRQNVLSWTGSSICALIWY